MSSLPIPNKFGKSRNLFTREKKQLIIKYGIRRSEKKFDFEENLENRPKITFTSSTIPPSFFLEFRPRQISTSFQNPSVQLSTRCCVLTHQPIRTSSNTHAGIVSCQLKYENLKTETLMLHQTYLQSNKQTKCEFSEQELLILRTCEKILYVQGKIIRKRWHFI